MYLIPSKTVLVYTEPKEGIIKKKGLTHDKSNKDRSS